MTELEELGLSGNAITDAGLTHLAELPNLKRVTLYDTKVTDAGVDKFRKALQDCYVDY